MRMSKKEDPKFMGIIDAEDGKVLVTSDAVYVPIAFTENMQIDDDYSKAYIYDGQYFPYRGKLHKHSILPGAYMDDNGVAKLIFPTSKGDDYSVEDKIRSIDMDSMIQTLKRTDSITYNYPSSGKHFIPEISNEDDILKRALKLALKAKCVDIDNCKDNFADRNALFNFKSVMKGDGRLSILLFDRGCEALGLEYYVVLCEKDNKHPIGASLDSAEAAENIGADLPRFKQNYKNEKLDLNGKIVVSTKDTYEQ